MRRSFARPLLVALCCLAVAGCAGTSARALGLTGAPVPSPPPPPSDQTIGQPGITASDMSTPSLIPRVMDQDVRGAAIAQ